MTILLAVLHHEVHGNVRVRVTVESDAYGYEGHGWRVISFVVWTPKRRLQNE